MSLKTVKRLAASLLGVGQSHIKVIDAKRASEALTKDDVRVLVQEKIIQSEQKTGIGRGKAKIKQARKKLGRRVGPGSAKGRKFALVSRKERWMVKVRSQRKLLEALSPSLVDGARKRVYSMVKGGLFQNKKQLVAYLKEKKMLK